MSYLELRSGRLELDDGLFRAEVPVVAVFTFVDGELGRAVVILSDPRGELGFFFRGIADFMSITYPAALGLVGLAWV